MSQHNNKPVLTYFSSRGKSEIIRLLLAEAGVDYEEVNVGVWHPTDKSEQFQQLVQNGSLAFDALPSYKDDQIFLVQSVTKEVSNSSIEETMDKIAREKLPKFISYFERALKGKTFLVGEKISYADIGLFYVIDNLLELNAEYTNKFILEKNENLKAFHGRIKSREGIHKHVTNPNRFPKQNLPGYETVLSKIVQQ
ncbi:hypothetical protein C9374_011945 [Naegleria lovaniensis]|uniref:Glutathione S-transferase n=1 Tax=Naegleria lovaniensis TaxID=51637 RepID=A0AA88KEZ6_NAELO|nr:uncharacterized protein C9374_011945 [Naegleria lovaniensis]KAG2373656.1 hypothetical protein C9374_011945 [Naegleria lovaniensis]